MKTPQLLAMFAVLALPVLPGGFTRRADSADAGDVVITEVMYHPGADNPGGEYVELFNRGAAAVNLSGWSLAFAVEFYFPPETMLGGQSYLMVYQDPGAPAHYGIANAVGPFTGRLSNTGEPVGLLDGAARLVDAVIYDDAAPWPTEADGAGASLELIDPALDNDDPTSWGIGQPYSPGLPNSPAPSGGGDVVIMEIMYKPLKSRLNESLDPFWIDKGPFWETDDDPSGEYVELFQRGDRPVDLSGWKLVDGSGVLFRFSPGTTLDPGAYLVVCGSAAVIAVQYGIANVVGDFASAGDLSDAGERLTLADGRGAVVDTVPYADEPPWPIAPDQLGASLECLDPTAANDGPENWRACLVAPKRPPPAPRVGDETFPDRGTPGRPNSRATVGVPPLVPLSALKHFPERPLPTDEVTITAAPSARDTLLELSLQYEVYRAPYQSPQLSRSVPMRDDGAGGDAAAGDGTYTAVVPPLESQMLVRYWLTAKDTLGRSWRYPDATEPNPNRAYFPYDGEEDTALPAYFLILPAASQAALDADIWTRENVDATLVAEGIVYDHVGIHYRGRGWRIHPKKSWNVAFNMTEYLRGMSGLDLAMHFPVLQKLVHDIFWSMGHGNLGTEVVRLYKNGSFHGLYLGQESPNASWLRRHGMGEEGETFKASCAPSFFPGGWSGTYVADLRPYEDAAIYPKLYERKSSSLGPFDSLIGLTKQVSDTPEAEIAATLSDAVELDSWLYRWAVHVAGAHGDIVGTNFFVLKPAEPEARWRLMYFDFDLFFGCKALDFVDVVCAPHTLDPWLYVNRFNQRVSRNPELRSRFLVILNDVLQNYMTVEKVSAMVDQYAEATVEDRNQELALGFGGPGPYVMSPPDPEEIKSYFALRRDWLLRTWLPSQGFEPAVNDHPTIRLDPPNLEGSTIHIRWTHEDREGDPAAVDLFWTDRKWSHLQPVSGAQGIPASAGSFLWPDPEEGVLPGIIIHGVIRDGVSDLEGHGESGPLPPPAPPVFSPEGGSVVPPLQLTLSSPSGVGGIFYTLDGSDPLRPGGRLSPGAIAYGGPITISESARVRARVRVDLGSGFWSDVAEAVFSEPAVPLAVTEVMYHATGGSDFDFIEIHNFGTRPLDLDGITLIDGVSFEFAKGDVKVLPPGGYAVVVSNTTAFASLYGEAGILVAGAYEGTLSDRGERLLIVDVVGTPVVDFTFRSSWYPETNGQGRSLILVDPRSLPETWGDPASWRPSADLDGSPGKADPNSVNPGTELVRGDSNADSNVDIADAVFSLGFQFLGGEHPSCLGTLDTNDSGDVDITDAIYLLGYLFLGGPPPPEPFSSCGSDPNGPSCESYEPCR